MNPAQIGIEQIKQNMRRTWMAGDFGQIARFTAKGAEEFIDRLNIRPEMRVLDVASGTGNLAIPAARLGAHVTGIDIAPNLLEQARQWASTEGLQATFEEGDAEKLPYLDAHFDLVMTMFGAMFAPRPEQVSSELSRVCRHGGTIAMANWTPGGFVGKMFELGSRYAPLPAGIPPPTLWGDEKRVRERLGTAVSRIETTPRMITFDYPFPPGEVVEHFRSYFGPVQVAFSKLDQAGQKAFSMDLENLWREHNKAEGDRTMIQGEYLEVIAIRA